MTTVRVLISLAVRFSKCHFSMVSGYSSKTYMIRHCLKKRHDRKEDLHLFWSKAQWKVRSSSIIPSSSLALDMEGILQPLLPLLDQQLTQPYLLVQYHSFLYCKKKRLYRYWCYHWCFASSTTGGIQDKLMEPLLVLP